MILPSVGLMRAVWFWPLFRVYALYKWCHSLTTIQKTSILFIKVLNKYWLFTKLSSLDIRFITLLQQFPFLLTDFSSWMCWSAVFVLFNGFFPMRVYNEDRWDSISEVLIFSQSAVCFLIRKQSTCHLILLKHIK